MTNQSFAPLRTVGALLALLASAGGATVSPDEGIGQVQSLARERLGNGAMLPAKDADPAATVAAIRDLLQKPLKVVDTVRIALLNNADLKVSLAELGISAAEVAQAGRFPNPRFTYSNRRNREITTIERTVMVSVMSLLAMLLSQQVAAEAATEFAARMAQVRNFNKLLELSWACLGEERRGMDGRASRPLSLRPDSNRSCSIVRQRTDLGLGNA